VQGKLKSPTGNQFATYFNVYSEAQLCSFLYDVVSQQTPVEIVPDGQNIYVIDGHELSIIIGSNGFIVTAHPGR
jgi:hypothetical protein